MKGAIATVILFLGIGIGHVVTKYIQPRHTTLDITPLRVTQTAILKPEILRMSITDPARHQELENCFINPIIINGTLVSKSPFIFRVDASDECKKSTRDFQMKVGSKGNYNYYLIGGLIALGMFAGYKLKR